MYKFAQALSLAAKSIGVESFIVMPHTAPQVKKDAVKGYGGIIIECEPTLLARENKGKEIEERESATFIHPSNNLDAILGQGTAATKLLEDQPDIEYIFTPFCCGGLIAGTALSA